MKWKNTIIILMAIIAMASVATAYDFDPGRDINLRDIYDIKNAVDIDTACINLSGDYRCSWIEIGEIPAHNALAGLQGGTTDQYYHLNQSVHDTVISKVFSWITAAFFDQDLNTTDSVTFVNITASNITADYYSGQPIEGGIGSGIISADRFLDCGCMNVTDDGGLQVTYPAHIHRIVHTDGTTNYCSLSENSFDVTDNQHTVYYVDSNCAVQSATFSNYYDFDINPANYSRIFDVYSLNGDIEGLKAATLYELTPRKARRLNVDCGGQGHLLICDGLDIQENTFPYFNQTLGHYNYINTVVPTTLEDSETDGVHFVYRSGGTWTHSTGTGINLTHCDDGSDLITCSNSKYRRYFVGTVGWGDQTLVHQLAALDSQDFANIGSCLNTVDSPLTDSYIIPPGDIGVFVMHHVYCGKRDDSGWTGAWLDLRGEAVSGGLVIDTSVFVTTDGERPLTGNWDVGLFNLTAHWFKGLFNWTEDSIYLTFDGNLLSFSEDQLNTTIDARAGMYYAGGDYLYLNASDYFFLNETVLNATIDSRAGQIYFADEVYINLNDSNYFIFNETSLNNTIDIRAVTSEVDPFWTDNSSTVARTGNCPAGQVVMNTTTSGVQCVAAVGEEVDPFYTGNVSNIAFTNIDETFDEKLTVTKDFVADPSGNVLYVNSTSHKVGVGTSNPLVKFTVQDGNILIDRTDASNAVLRLRNVNDEAQIYIHSTEGDIRFYNDADLMTIEPGGNVGIGTTSPTAKLDIRSASGFTRALRIGPQTDDEGNGSYIEFTASSVDGYGAQIGGIRETPGAGGLGALVIRTGGNAQVERMRITDAGNIGIGTTTPQNKLNIAGDLNVTSKSYMTDIDFNDGWTSGGLSIINGDIYAQTGYFYNITGLDVQTLKVNGSLLPQTGFDNQFDLGSSSLRWNELYLGGKIYAADWTNVTITESQVLDADWWDADADIDADEISESKIAFSTDCPSGSYYYLSGNDLACKADPLDTITEWKSLCTDCVETSDIGDILDASHITDIYVFSDGDTMTGELVIDPNAATVGMKIYGATNYRGTFFMDASNIFNIYNYNASLGDVQIGHTSGGTPGIYYDGSSGYIGIGTSSPEATLEVLHPNTAAGGIRLQTTKSDAAQKDARIKMGHYTNAEEPITMMLGTALSTANTLKIGGGSGVENAMTQIKFYTAANSTTPTGTERMTIDSAGEVGIGTTTPSRTLDVNNLIGVEHAGNEKIYLYAASGGADVMFTGAGGDVRFDTRTGGDTYFTAGNIGIGTTSPDSLLHVEKNDEGNIILTTIQNLNTTNTSSGVGIFLQPTATADRGAKIWTDRGGGDGASFALRFGISTAADPITATKMIIENSGDVGIGTATPGAKLDLQGTIGQDLLRFSHSSSPTAAGIIMGFNADDTKFDIQTEYGDVVYDTITIDRATRNIGIGTITPQNTLNVVGVGNFTGNLYGGTVYSGGNVVWDAIGDWQSACSDCINVNDIGDILTADEITDIYAFTAGDTMAGALVAADHGAAGNDEMVNVVYTTTTCPAVGGTTIGTLCIIYTA